MLLSVPRIRYAEKGHTEGENVYVAFGQTFGGRYLSVFFIYKTDTATAIVISARDMSDKERRAYGRK
ncbi:MAG: BrnT family toxin [Roseiflexaceae bacterium]